MIERIWAKNFRMLAHNRVDLMPFAVLVGRNATGKSTLMAAIRFVSNSLSLGVQAAVDIAIDHAGAGLADLCFDPAVPLQFALEVRLVHGLYRYELEIGRDIGGAGFVSRENLFRLPDSPQSRQFQPSLFGSDDFDELVHNEAPRSQKWRRIAGKTAEGKRLLQGRKTDWNNTFRFGSNRPRLGSLPEDSIDSRARSRFATSFARGSCSWSSIRMLCECPRPPGASRTSFETGATSRPRPRRSSVKMPARTGNGYRT